MGVQAVKEPKRSKRITPGTWRIKHFEELLGNEIKFRAALNWLCLADPQLERDRLGLQP